MKLRAFSILGSVLAAASCLADSYTITIPPGGGRFIANQLDNGGNTLNEVLPNAEGGDTLFKGDCSGQMHLAAIFDDVDPVWIVVGPLPSDGTLAPGEGAFYRRASTGTSSTLTFTGTPHVPVLPATLPCGCGEYNLLSRQTNGIGTFENITGLPPTDGAQVLRHNPGHPSTPLQAPNYTIYSFSGGTWTPGVPVLDVGEAAWFFIPCNLCITLQCANDLVVECGSSWDFTPPTVVDTCCGGNVSISVVATVTNGTCPQIITRSWLAADACNNSAACSQRITVLDSTPPTIVCAGDKTVACGSLWTFETPTAIDGCCADAVSVSILGTITNSGCPMTITRTWRATDCCGNASATCGQTVTVVESAPPTLACAADKTVECGVSWTFDTPVSSACCANVTITPLSTITNGSCPKTITRTWQAADCCANVATCSQTVTLVDTTPPVLLPPVSIAQQAYLKASNSRAFDAFGTVAVSGDTVVVGSDQDISGGPGAAYIFARNGDTWSQQAVLHASNADADDWFGEQVAISGDTVVVAAPNESSNATGVNGDGTDNSAHQSGAAYVFVRTGTTWSQQAYLKASNTDHNDHFGTSVAVSGDTVVVGARDEDSGATGVNGDQGNPGGINGIFDSAGAAYVFVRSGTTWSQQAYLKASNTRSLDGFGTSVAVSGDTVVVGAVNEDSSATGVGGNQADIGAPWSGAAYVFVRNGTTWSQEAYLKASNTRMFNGFGWAMAMSGNTIVVSAPGESSSSTGVNGNQNQTFAFDEAGAAYVFVRNGTTWSQEAYLKASDTNPGYRFGWSVAVSGDTVVVGGFGTGAYVFGRSGTTWAQQAHPKGSNTEPGDSFGSYVGIWGGTAVVGAVLESSNFQGVQNTSLLTPEQADNSAQWSGAAYIFNNVGTVLTHKTVECGSTWSFDLPTAADACSGTNVTFSVLTTVTNGSCPQIITRTWMATDACGNSSTFAQTVTVVNTTQPVINCAPDKTVECGSAWDFDLPTAASCCGANLSVTILGTVTNNLGPCSQLLTRTWQATDCCANSSTCSQKVTVLDTTPPVLACPANLTVQCDAEVPAPNPATVTATDNCGPAPVVAHKSDTASGTCPKTITRTYQATDACGNIGSGTQTITVQDTIAPVLSGCVNISAVAQSCQGGTILSFAVSALDNCDGAVPVKYTPGPGFFAIGTTVVTCEALDHCGNHGSCTFTVSISPPAKPLGLCSFTQGFYGNAKGKFNALPSLTLVGNLLAQGPLVVGKLGSRSLSFLPSDAALLQQRLPAGGTAATLPNGDQTLPTAVLPLNSKGGFDNILLGQSVTLSLNVLLSPALLCLGIVPNFCTEGTLPGPDGLRGTSDDVLNLSDNLSFTIPNSVRTALADPLLGINNSSVQGLLELANRALAAQPTGAASLADINAAVDAINRGFDNCRVLIDCTTHAVLPDSYNDGFNNRPPPTSGSSHGRSRGVNIRARASNVNSTKEPLEPDHAGNAGGKSLWWQWQAPFSGPVTIQTDGSSFDTLLAVYLGTSLSDLTLVASNDDSHGLSTSEVTFLADAGADYQIAVDGFEGASGTVVLTILVEPTRLGPPILLPNDQVQLSIDGSSGGTYTVEASPDLGNWTPIASVENTNGSLLFPDPGARNVMQRFYRVLLEL